MPLPNFDSTKHHIGLAPTGQTLKGYLLTGGYRVDPLRESAPTEYGGTGDVLDAGSLARWTMDDFSGGAYQGLFDDPAMFAESINFLPSLIEKTARSVAPLVYFAAAGGITADAALGVFSTGGSQIAVIDSDAVRFYDAEGGTLVTKRADDADGTLVDPSSDIYAAVHDPADNAVYVIARRHSATEPTDQLNGAISASDTELTMDSASDWPTNGVVRIGSETIYYRGKTATKLQNLQRGMEGTTAASHADNAATSFRRQYFLGSLTQAAGITWIGWIPNSAVGPPRGMAVTAGRDVLVQMSTALWLLDLNDARDSLTATRIGRLPGRWVDAVTYNGLTYILLTDSEQLTSIYAWDGTQVLPVTDFPYNFLGSCIGIYGGRIYVGGRGQDINDTDKYAELYEITGASLRLVKSYGSEARAGQTVPANFYSMVVHEGMLFLGTNITQLIAYDLTRDALWPGIQIYENAGRTLQARHLLSTRQKLFAWCYDTNRSTPKDGFYRMATADADLTIAGSGGPGVNVSYAASIITSDFAPEPDRDKRWAKLRVVTRYGVKPTAWYSEDGGDNYTALAAGTDVQTTDLRITDFDLSGLTPSPAIRFAIYQTRSTQTVAYGEMVAMTVSFLWLDSGKYVWSFSVLGVDNPETLDGVYADYDVETLRTTLRGFYENKTTLDFKDRDGVTRTAYVSQLSESEPLVAEAGDGSQEAFFSVTLTEV